MENRAFYKRDFLRIQLPFLIKKNFNEYSQEELGKYIHEYIHFLQNSLTLWGRFGGIIRYDQLAFKLKKLEEKYKGAIKLPYQPELPKDKEKWNKIWHEGEGSQFAILENKVRINLDGQSFVPEEGILLNKTEFEIDGKKYPKAILTFSLNSYGKIEIDFGAWIIKESMAQIIQDFISPPSYERVPQIPYDIIYKYCETNHKEILKDKKKIITICWASLFSMNPGTEFIRLIKMASENPDLDNFEFYKFYLENSIITAGERKWDIKEALCDSSYRYLNTLRNLLKSDCEYFKYVLKTVDPLEIHDNIMSLIEANDSTKFEEIMGKIGEPLVFGTKNTSSLPYLKDNPESLEPALKLFSLENINDFLSSYDGKCPNYSLCDEDSTIEKSYDCYYNPLLRSSACPFYWTAYGLRLLGREIEITSVNKAEI